MNIKFVSMLMAINEIENRLYIWCRIILLISLLIGTLYRSILNKYFGGTIFIVFYVLFWISTSIMVIIDSYKIFKKIPTEIFYTHTSYKYTRAIYYFSRFVFAIAFIVPISLKIFNKISFIYIIPGCDIAELIILLHKQIIIENKILTDSNYTIKYEECITNIINSASANITDFTTYKNVKNNRYDCNTCAICLDKYKQTDVVTILECQHLYHYTCVNQWFIKSSQCPICRIESLV